MAALALTQACALSPLSSTSPDFDPTLLSGERTFGERLADHEAPEYRIAAVSPAMRSYVRAAAGDRGSQGYRFRRLLEALIRDGYFVTIDPRDRTLTSAEAFEAGIGNCLSYTNLFIALAREAGLSADYQLVDVPATWDADAGFLIRYTHVNVRLRGLRPSPKSRPTLTVDFNAVRVDDEYPRHVITDAQATALFYANRAVDLLRRGEPRAGFAHLREALDIAPEFADLWINLGAFYAVQGDHRSAIEAYQVALQVDVQNRSALAGLARSHASLGEHALADRYEERVRRYRDANPYYHFALAQRAYDAAEFERALDAIDHAIALKRRASRFHLLKGLIESELGRAEAAAASFREAERHGLEPETKARLVQSLGATIGA